MKNLRLSVIASLAIGLCTTASATSLQEALTSGKISGEVTATYETRNFKDDDKKVAGYVDNAYSVGSLALKYETGVWNNLSLTSKFRAYATIFEDTKGDSDIRFYDKNGENKDVDAEELFLTYTPLDNVTVKAGRQFISSHWVNKTQDALKIDAAFGDTSLEAIWTKRQGRIYARDYRPMTSVNGDKGSYQVALTHKFNDTISVTAYDAIVPDQYDIIGGKVNLKLGAVSLGGHYASAKYDEDSDKDSNLMHFTASTSIAGFSPYIGYIKVDDEGSFPGWSGAAGETIDPFEEGDYIYEPDAKTVYLGVSKSFGDLSATLLYGQTDYLSGTEERKVKETTLWLGYPITKDLKANLGYTTVDEDENSNKSDMNQLNLTLVYSF